MGIEIISEPELRAFRSRFNRERNFMSSRMKEMFSETGRNSLFYEPSAWLLERIQLHTPYWTGNLRAAHAMELTSFQEGAVTILWHIEPGHIHPVIPEEAYIYGADLVDEGRYANWFEIAYFDYIDQYMDMVEEAWDREVLFAWNLGP